MYNRIRTYLRPQSPTPRPTIPFSLPTSPTPADSTGLPPVYHSACGSRCVWSFNRRTAIATPICPKCTQLRIAG